MSPFSMDIYKYAIPLWFQSILLGSQGTRERNNESFCSEFSYVSSGGENLMWVEEDLGNNCIMVRYRSEREWETILANIVC